MLSTESIWRSYVSVFPKKETDKTALRRKQRDPTALVEEIIDEYNKRFAAQVDPDHIAEKDLLRITSELTKPKPKAKPSVKDKIMAIELSKRGTDLAQYINRDLALMQRTRAIPESVIKIFNKLAGGNTLTKEETDVVYHIYSGVVPNYVAAVIMNNPQATRFLSNTANAQKTSHFVRIDDHVSNYTPLACDSERFAKSNTFDMTKAITKEAYLNNLGLDSASVIKCVLRFNKITHGLEGKDLLYSCDLTNESNNTALFLAGCPSAFLEKLEGEAQALIKKSLNNLRSIRLRSIAEYIFNDGVNRESHYVERTFFLSTRFQAVTNSRYIENVLAAQNNYIDSHIYHHAVGKTGSGYSFERIVRYSLNIIQNVSLRGGKFLRLVGILKTKENSLINVHADKKCDPDEILCFKNCIDAHFFGESIKEARNRNRATYYRTHKLHKELNYSALNFPVVVEDSNFEAFEADNGNKIALRIYLYSIKEDAVSTYYESENFGKEGVDSIGLVYIPREGHPDAESGEPGLEAGRERSEQHEQHDGELGHFAVIRNKHASALDNIENFLCNIDGDRNMRYTCSKCRAYTTRDKDVLDNHKENCQGEALTQIIMPNPGERKRFNDFGFQQWCPIAMYYDTEAYQVRVNPEADLQIKTLTTHIISSISLIVVRVDAPTQIYSFHGADCGQRFLDKVHEISSAFIDFITNKDKYAKAIKDEESLKLFNAADICHICHKKIERLCDACERRLHTLKKEQFASMMREREAGREAKINLDEFAPCEFCAHINVNNYKVFDHDHVTGKYRGAAHNTCNLNFRLSHNFRVPVFAHNAQNYDNNLILTELVKHPKFSNKIEPTAITGEKYMAIRTKTCEFKDTCKHLLSSLDDAAYNLLWQKPISCVHCAGVIQPLEIVYEEGNFVGTFRCGKCVIHTPPIIKKAIAAEVIYKTFKITTQSCTHHGAVNNEKLALILSKGIYPYRWVDSTSKLDQTHLPPIEDFTNDLEKGYADDAERGKCSEHDYKRAQTVWKTFDCKTMRDYELIYLISDTTLLADIFEAYRAENFKLDGLDPAWYLTVSQFSASIVYFDNYKAKINGQVDYKLDLNDERVKLLPIPEGVSTSAYFNDPEPILEHNQEIYEILEKGIRGGLCNATCFYSRANNPLCPQYDANKPTKYIMYNDVVSLYAGIMTKNLPSSNLTEVLGADFEEVTNLEFIRTWKDDSPVGAIYVVTAYTPEHLHDEFSDLPLICEKRDVKYEELSDLQKYIRTMHLRPGLSESEQCEQVKASMKGNEKLISTLGRVQNYAVHYQMLKYWLEKGVVVETFHRAFVFKQTPWIRNHIDKFAGRRKVSKTEASKNLTKTIMNSFFGKNMENKRKRCNVKILDTEDEKQAKKILALMNDPFYRGHMDLKPPNELGVNADGMEESEFSGHRAVLLGKEKVKLDVMMVTGFAILELSKLSVYKYWYEYVKRRYPRENSKLLYQDTDSLIFEAYTQNIYDDMKADNGVLFNFDMANCEGKYKNTRFDKVPLTMKSETGTDPIVEYIGLCSKSYSCITVRDMANWKQKIKGDRNLHRHEEYRRVLFEYGREQTTFCGIRSKKHIAATVEVTKFGLCAFTDKRFYIAGTYSTLAHGHYRIEKGEFAPSSRETLTACQTQDECQREQIDVHELKRNMELQRFHYTADIAGNLYCFISDKVPTHLAVVHQSVKASEPQKICAKAEPPKEPRKDLQLITLTRAPEYKSSSALYTSTTLDSYPYGLLQNLSSILPRVTMDDITIMRIEIGDPDSEAEQKKSLFAAYRTKKLVETPYFSAHEVIFGDRPQKICFDVDYEVEGVSETKCAHEEADLLAHLRRAIIQTFTEVYARENERSANVSEPAIEPDIHVMSASGWKVSTNASEPPEIYKISFHILVSVRYAVSSSAQSKRFAQIVKSRLPSKYACAIDMGIYNKRHNLRVLGSHKHLVLKNGAYQAFNYARIKRAIDPISFQDSLITNTSACAILPDIFVPEPKAVNICISDRRLEAAIELALAQNAFNEAEFSVRGYSGSYINFTRHAPSHCDLCARTHEKDNTLALYVSAENEVWRCCSKTHKRVKIGKIDIDEILSSSESENESEIASEISDESWP